MLSKNVLIFRFPAVSTCSHIELGVDCCGAGDVDLVVIVAFVEGGLTVVVDGGGFTGAVEGGLVAALFVAGGFPVTVEFAGALAGGLEIEAFGPVDVDG